ncbi:MAG: alpha/beta hydrolase [Anaerolineae bacterium]|jgi:pimeloyl-ACP methyl ester carboxylesterase|nr:alpha/beta hydrolase [Anaerolineae bacterium]
MTALTRISPAVSPAAAVVSRRVKHIHTLEQPAGPLVVDVYEPVSASAAPPVLLIHGWGGTGSYWRQTAHALSETVTVIVPDLPGTGRSQPVRAPRSMFDQVATLQALLADLQVERVQVVGHSMGGGMAVLLAAECPQRVERLVLTSLTFFMTASQKQTYLSMMTLFRAMMHFRPAWLEQVPGMAGLMAKQYFYRVPDDPATLREGLHEYLALDRETALRCAADAVDDRIPRAGAMIRVPTLLVAGRHDQMMPAKNVTYTLSILPNSQVRWIEACGHLPMVEKPAEYQSILRDFLQL